MKRAPERRDDEGGEPTPSKNYGVGSKSPTVILTCFAGCRPHPPQLIVSFQVKIEINVVP